MPLSLPASRRLVKWGTLGDVFSLSLTFYAVVPYFAPAMHNDYGLTVAQTGWIIAALPIGLLMASFLTAPLRLHRYSIQQLRLMMVATSVVSSLGMCGIGLTPPLLVEGADSGGRLGPARRFGALDAAPGGELLVEQLHGRKIDPGRLLYVRPAKELTAFDDQGPDACVPLPVGSSAGNGLFRFELAHEIAVRGVAPIHRAVDNRRELGIGVLFDDVVDVIEARVELCHELLELVVHAGV